jgi:hypothetical protein
MSLTVPDCTVVRVRTSKTRGWEKWLRGRIEGKEEEGARKKTNV